MNPLPDLSIVIPLYRSQETLGPLLDRLTAELDRQALEYEIICVEDAGPDDSWQTLVQRQRQRPDRIVAIQLMRNFGQHNALMCGFRHARGRYVLTMDDDLQHPPEEVAGLVEAARATGLDVIYGVPRERHHRTWRNLGSTLVTAFYRLVFRTRIRPSAFRIMRREVVEAILTYDLNYTFIDGLLAWNTQRIGEVRVRHEARKTGRSGYTLARLLFLALNLFTNFSLLPLQVVSLCGSLSALIGMVLGGYYMCQHFLGQIEVPGYASIIVSVFVLGGLQLLALGVIGEYLGRLHLNVNRRPQYAVREMIASTANSNPPDRITKSAEKGNTIR